MESVKELVIFGVIAFSLFVVGMVLAYPYFVSGSNYDIVFVSKTEYVQGDIGQVIVELRNEQTSSVISANCNATIWYPDKTLFVTNQTMLPTASGSQYINFTVPATEGTYEYQAVCRYAPSKTAIRSSSFHVSSEYRLLTENIDDIPLVNFVEQGVTEARSDKWNINSWRVEGNGTMSNIACYIKEPGLFQTQTFPPTGSLASCGMYGTGANFAAQYAFYGVNLMALYNSSQCYVDCPTDSSPTDFYTAPASCIAQWYVYHQADNRGIRYVAFMGVLTDAEFDLLDCGLSRSGVQPDWWASGSPSGLNYSIGSSYCFITDEGYRAKARMLSRADCCSVGCKIWLDGFIWINCEEGAFIVNSEKWGGFSWYSNHSIYDVGENYEIGCKMNYTVDNESFMIDDLKQYVYINNENRIKAVVVK